jgi:uncharacterized protein
MEIIQEPSQSGAIKSYEKGSVLLMNGRRYQTPVLFHAEGATQLSHTEQDTLFTEHLQETLQHLPADIYVVGTGDKTIFPPDSFLHNIDCMSSRSACGTYNVLLSEGRRVVLALLI